MEIISFNKILRGQSSLCVYEVLHTDKRLVCLLFNMESASSESLSVSARLESCIYNYHPHATESECVCCVLSKKRDSISQRARRQRILKKNHFNPAQRMEYVCGALCNYTLGARNQKRDSRFLARSRISHRVENTKSHSQRAAQKGGRKRANPSSMKKKIGCTRAMPCGAQLHCITLYLSASQPNAPPQQQCPRHKHTEFPSIYNGRREQKR
jgi:hypothetical protein